MDLLLTALDWLNATVLVYFVAFNGFYLLTTLVAHRALLRYARRLRTVDVDDLLGSAAAPPISLLVPGYNEELTCVESVRSLLTLRYHAFEIMFINDGSTDQTLARMVEAFDLRPVRRAPVSDVPSRPVRGVYRSRRHPALWVLDKENGGSKADALNAGIAYCRTPLFCAIDADSLLERDALMRIVRPFLEDRSTVAAGGIIRIINGGTVRAGAVSDMKLPRSLLACFQVLEYLRSFLAGRVGWGGLNGTLVISGAFGAFDCATVVAAGGYATSTVGEDMELVVRLHRYCRERGMRYHIEYIPDPVAWTECPEDVATLGRQRRRWQRGLTETLLIHRRMLLRPLYGAVGMLAFPFNFFFEMLGPAIEVAGYLGILAGILLGRVTPLQALAFFLVAFVLGIVLSVAAVALEEQTFRRYPRRRDLAGLFALAFLEVLGYRQLNAWWRIQGMWAVISRKREGWGVMKRKGFAAVLLLVALPAFQLTAQDSLAWRATGSYGFEAFTDSRSPWHAATLALSHHKPRLTAIAQADAYRRFDVTDIAAVADVYTTFRRGTYAEWRVQWAPDAEVVAQTEAGLELFHAPARGWELSAGYRHGEYAASAVDLAMAGAAHYAGHWYLRLRGTGAFQSGSEGLSISLLARRMGGNPDDLAELQGGLGEEIVTQGPGSVDLAPTAFVAARWQRRLTSRFGCSATASWNRQEGIPNRAGLTVGVFTRW